MKKTATILALAGLSMAAKTDHAFLGRKPVEIKADIDPKMVIKPAHDIDPGMVRKPHRNIDPGMVIKPKKTQGTTILAADDADDELLLIYRPADNIDPGMVRMPPVGSDIDPKFVIKPPRGFDDGIYVRPRTRPATVWVDDEMRLVNGAKVDPGMVIKPRRGDIDPGMVRKPVKGWEIDPKIFVKPKRGDVLYADDDELAVVSNKTKKAKEHKLIGDFPINWPGMPIYADAEDDELALVGTVSVSDPIIHGHSHDDAADDELVYALGRIDPGMVRRPPNSNIDQGILRRPKDNIKYYDAENDDEFAVLSNKTKKAKEHRLIGDFPINWPGQPVYADDADNELRHFVSDQTIPMGKITRDDELFYGGVKRSPFVDYADAVSDTRFPMRPSSFNLRDDELVAIRPMGTFNRVQNQAQDDELVQMTEFVREPRVIGESKPSSHDDEMVYASKIDQGMIRRPYYETVDSGIYKRPMGNIRYFDAENDDELVQQVREPRLIGDFPVYWPGKPVYADAEDDELILFADLSLDKPRKGIFDPKELTKPWYQQQRTMYADDADDELVYINENYKPPKVNDLKTGKSAMVTGGIRPPKRPVKPVKEADDELIMFADKSLDARLEKRKPFDLKELTKPWYEQRHTMYADDTLVALGELLEDN